MKYGYFDDQNREYVITNPRTPVKWINYVGTLGFGGFVEQVMIQNRASSCEQRQHVFVRHDFSQQSRLLDR